MKIMPHMSRGIAFLREDGRTLDMLPFQVYLANGMTVFRIGSNILKFTAAGHFDGEEFKASGVGPDSPEVETYMAAHEQSRKNDGQPPEDFYHGEGEPWRAAEERGRGIAVPPRAARHH
jgi:hypothetical protein